MNAFNSHVASLGQPYSIMVGIDFDQPGDHALWEAFRIARTRPGDRAIDRLITGLARESGHQAKSLFSRIFGYSAADPRRRTSSCPLEIQSVFLRGPPTALAVGEGSLSASHLLAE